MNSCNQPISLCKLLYFGMDCLRSHQYLMKNQGNFGRFSMFHSQAGLFDESFDYEFQEQKNKC